jgi:hypothetical protein
MARKCTCRSVPAAQSVCCIAATRGLLGRPFILQTARGPRCAQCDGITRKNGKPGFHFHFTQGQSCGLGAGGCPALAQAAGAPSTGGGISSFFGLAQPSSPALPAPGQVLSLPPTG